MKIYRRFVLDEVWDTVEEAEKIYSLNRTC